MREGEGRETTCGYHQLIMLTQVGGGTTKLKDIISRRPSLNTNTGCWKIYLLFAWWDQKLLRNTSVSNCHKYCCKTQILLKHYSTLLLGQGQLTHKVFVISAFLNSSEILLLWWTVLYSVSKMNLPILL